MVLAMVTLEHMDEGAHKKKQFGPNPPLYGMAWNGMLSMSPAATGIPGQAQGVQPARAGLPCPPVDAFMIVKLRRT